MQITLTTHHGDDSTTSLEFTTDRTDAILAAIEELIESPAMMLDHNAVVSIGIRHEDSDVPVLILGVGGF